MKKAAAATLLLCACLSCAGPAISENSARVCEHGAVYRALAVSPESEDIVVSESAVIVKRSGFGKSKFGSSGTAQVGVALDIFIPSTNTRGAAVGPMRSSMFPVDNADVLTEQGYQWHPAEVDTGGVYRVLSPDGKHTLLFLKYVECARNPQQ